MCLQNAHQRRHLCTLLLISNSDNWNMHLLDLMFASRNMRFFRESVIISALERIKIAGVIVGTLKEVVGCPTSSSKAVVNGCQTSS